ncbi:MAG: tRNA (5-methylaminomethyl-2-thiouridine)(34)-methyltransferase MnmD [Muribaculaceae bacterium]|nr:tRNA (5-methylaminomethyl-2-thiouridine)(34)-methyltransferase MnmD [Muribaculaceae bacterium]
MQLQPTADGSFTIFRNDIDEHYHSVKGALAESLHVYINLGLRHYHESIVSVGNSCKEGRPVRVFEVGFGTGLNAALTAIEAERTGLSIEYFSIELYPLSERVIKEILINHSAELSDMLAKVNFAEWNRSVKINNNLVLHKLNRDLLDFNFPTDLDVVYFDAFAPEKQPEMWTSHIFTKLFNSMSDGGVLTTYCAKGAIRRLLQTIGFRTERMPGPPHGKREVLRATK